MSARRSLHVRDAFDFDEQLGPAECRNAHFEARGADGALRQLGLHGRRVLRVGQVDARVGNARKGLVLGFGVLARRRYERGEVAERLVELLAKVSEEDRRLLLLKEVEGHSVEELAQMTGMNENTIKVKLFRARQKLVKAAQRLLPGLSGALFH